MKAVIANPVNALLNECAQYSKVREEPINSNKGTEVSYWLVQAGSQPGEPWCAAYVSQMGLQSLGAAWPVPRLAFVQSIVDWATKRNLLTLTPSPGDLMVVYYDNLQRFAHIGVVETVQTTGFTTWEGNTNTDGSRDGYGVFHKVHSFGPRYKFIHWQTLLAD